MSRDLCWQGGAWMFFPPPQYLHPHGQKLVPHRAPCPSFNLCMQRCDHAALTTDHNAIPSEVVRDSSGSYHRMTVGSVSGPSGVTAGPRHCAAIRAAT